LEAGFDDRSILFAENPTSALELIKSRLNYVNHHEEKHRAVSEEQARKLVEAEGIKVLDIYAVCGWMDVLNILGKVQNSHDWDE
jgi:hypothetical protein